MNPLAVLRAVCLATLPASFATAQSLGCHELGGILPI